ncbi:MAG: hypothetical protein RLY31_2851 [Bacteroidota bacterium]|jgi:acetylglutamate kinase
MKVLNIVKVGGQVLEDTESLAVFLSAFGRLEGPKMLIHGGGRKASELARRLGTEPRLVDGRRITDGDTLDIVTMVYAGLVNKTVVARLFAIGCPALGLSGADADVLRSTKRPVLDTDYGFVGDVQQVDARLLLRCLSDGITPVLCAITHDGAGQLLNTNADTVAAAVAAALVPSHRVRLTYCFEKPGILLDLRDTESVLPSLDPELYNRLKSNGTIQAGMLPKVDNAMEALGKGVEQVRICSWNALETDEGTWITTDIDLSV